MKEIISKYHLKTGLVVATLFPGIFIFSNSEVTGLFNRFLSCFIFIFILWFFNFRFIDLRLNKPFKTKQSTVALLGKIFLSFFVAIVLYISIGYTIDETGIFLSQVSG